MYKAIWVFVTFFLLTGCTGILSKPNKEKMEEVKAVMLEDLETKYNKEFVVEEVKYISNTSDYTMQLHLEGHEEISLMAYFNAETGNVGDTFLLSYWREESNDQFSKIFYTYFPQTFTFREHSAAVNFDPADFRYLMVDEGYPALKTIMEKYPDHVAFGIGGEVVIGRTRNPLSEQEIRHRRFLIPFCLLCK